jgi:hypothetical protein
VVFVQRILWQLFQTWRKRDLFFVTHYDSKSQHLNLVARASCLLLGSLSAGIFSLWVLIGVSRNWMGSTSATLPTWRQGCFFLTVRLNGLFIFTRNGNDSDGAVDNASGVGIPALSLTSVSGDGWRLHTPRDRFSLLDERGLEEMGKFLLATVQWLDTGRKEWHVVSRP